MYPSLGGFNVTTLWEIDPALIPNDPHLLQNPFLPRQRPVGPNFLDTEACLCNRQLDPGTSLDVTPGFLWRCVGDQTEGARIATSGKWFRPSSVDESEVASISQLPISDATNPPDRSTSLQWDSDSGLLVPGSENLSVWDKACTGENHTTFSTSFYRATRQIERGDLPVDAAPCWRPGAVPLQIQNVSQWETSGCQPGFLCMYYPTRELSGLLIHSIRCEQHRQLAPSILSAV